ncbi:hypothetical protein AV530_018517 [Patagioenas fasciata monilis]|uniref:Uncharacterized protein n=1 Tax=Patagioenas fasciata monilis TaxID=372326 RepID=A0A1V4JSM1_PATFA|nr:hypothetical protein AV530_018517 [Patagioenas fasciata monilis]
MSINFLPSNTDRLVTLALMQLLYQRKISIPGCTSRKENVSIKGSRDRSRFSQAVHNYFTRPCHKIRELDILELEPKPSVTIPELSHQPTENEAEKSFRTKDATRMEKE